MPNSETLGPSTEESPLARVATSEVPDLLPRMTPREIEAIRRLYRDAPVILEFGCGGSTRLAVESEAPKILSVESDKSWVELIARNPLVAAAISDKRLVVTYVDIGPIGEWGRPSSKRTAKLWPRYHSSIWGHPWLAQPNAVVLVDGRFRVACALQAALHQQTPFTLLVHDCTPRGGYPILDRFFARVEIVDSLAIFRSRELTIQEVRGLAVALLEYSLNWH